MKALGIGIGGLLGLLVLLGLGLLAASELQEVVVLHSMDKEGNEYETRLWIVEYGGETWLRGGAVDRDWVLRVRGNVNVRLTRGGIDTLHRAYVASNSATREEIDRRMREKYGMTDYLIQLLERFPITIPVRLDAPILGPEPPRRRR